MIAQRLLCVKLHSIWGYFNSRTSRRCELFVPVPRHGRPALTRPKQRSSARSETVPSWLGQETSHSTRRIFSEQMPMPLAPPRRIEM